MLKQSIDYSGIDLIVEDYLPGIEENTLLLVSCIHKGDHTLQVRGIYLQTLQLALFPWREEKDRQVLDIPPLADGTILTVDFQELRNAISTGTLKNVIDFEEDIIYSRPEIQNILSLIMDGKSKEELEQELFNLYTQEKL